jgi:hypothetical protein
LITNSIFLLKAQRCNPSTQEVYKRDPEKEEQKFRNSEIQKKKKRKRKMQTVYAAVHV